MTRRGGWSLRASCVTCKKTVTVNAALAGLHWHRCQPAHNRTVGTSPHGKGPKMTDETLQQETLEQARARWHSDDPIVCLRRALSEVALFEQIEKDRKAATSADPMERVIVGIQNLKRIADTLEKIAGVVTEPEPSSPLAGERPGVLMGALVGAAIATGLGRPEDRAAADFFAVEPHQPCVQCGERGIVDSKGMCAGCALDDEPQTEGH